MKSVKNIENRLRRMGMSRPVKFKVAFKKEGDDRLFNKEGKVWVKPPGWRDSKDIVVVLDYSLRNVGSRG